MLSKEQHEANLEKIKLIKDFVNGASARLTTIESSIDETNDRIEFVEDCLIEMSETVYGG